MTPQRLRLIVPPTLAELLGDDVYARYFRRDPVMPPGIRGDAPWQIIGRRIPGATGSSWTLQMMPSYADAHRRVRRMLDDPQWEDLTICSRAVTFRPPLGFAWRTGRFSWCGRCRRPVAFRPMKLHPVLKAQLAPALRDAVMLSSDEPERCCYCGARRTLMPRYSPRGRGT